MPAAHLAQNEDTARQTGPRKLLAGKVLAEKLASRPHGTPAPPPSDIYQIQLSDDKAKHHIA